MEPIKISVEKAEELIILRKSFNRQLIHAFNAIRNALNIESLSEFKQAIPKIYFDVFGYTSKVEFGEEFGYANWANNNVMICYPKFTLTPDMVPDEVRPRYDPIDQLTDIWWCRLQGEIVKAENKALGKTHPIDELHTAP